MKRYVALLRGINSGKNPNTKMEGLRKVFEEMGFENVKTYIASGNVIFDSSETDVAALENTLEMKLEPFLGFKSDVVLRTIEQLQDLVKADPFKQYIETKTNRFYVSFLKSSADIPITLPVEGKGYEIFKNIYNALCSVIFLEKTKTPDLMNVLDKLSGKKITTRSWNTVKKLSTL